MSRRISVKLFSPARLTWFSILLLAMCHGGLYASYLPPWGLVDEEQHVHYIQSLAEQRSIPIVGRTYLSPEIADSVIETRRREVFHWSAPPSPDPQMWGLEGFSYEGYQPPLFYILITPLYVILPSDILIKVYGLRWAMVGLSLLTVWMTFRIASTLFPQERFLSYLTCLLLIMIPERAMSVSRVNNDVLLEIVATMFVWACTKALLQGLSIQHSRWLGLLLGLGVLTKIHMALLVVFLSFVFWIYRRNADWWLCIGWTGGIASLLIVPFLARNLWLYGDLTGFAGFRVVSGFIPLKLTWQAVGTAVWDLIRHFWFVWWKGAQAGTNPLVTGIHIVLAGIGGLSAAGLMLYLRRHNLGQMNKQAQVIWIYVLVIAVYVVAILVTYFDGSVPVIQGRFFLPVIAPVVILLGWGLWQIPHGKTALLGAIGLLVVVSALSLFGNLLPYFYYWSAFVENGELRPYTPQTWQAAWALFYPRFLNDKPEAMRSWLIWMLPVYAAALMLVGWQLKRLVSRPAQEV